MSDDLLDLVKAGVGDAREAPAVHDLMHRAVAAMVASVNGDEFPTSAEYSSEELARRTDAFENLVAPIVRASAWGGFYGDSATRMLWPGLVGRAANTVARSEGNQNGWHVLAGYPAVLLLYAVGIATIAGDRPGLLATLLANRAVLERKTLKPVALELHATSAFINDLASRLPGFERHKTAASDRVYGALLPLMTDDLIASEDEFADLFDRFEYVLALVRYDMSRGDTERGWAPGGRFLWRREEGHRVDEDVRAEITEMKERWPLLREGLFRGSSERLTKAVDGVGESLRRW